MNTRNFLSPTASQKAAAWMLVFGMVFFVDDVRLNAREDTARGKSVHSADQVGTKDTPSNTESDQIYNERLKPVIRAFERKRMFYKQSEQDYFERLHLLIVSFSSLELRSSPGNFAGDVPQHNSFAFSEYVDSAEKLLAIIREYNQKYPTNIQDESGRSKLMQLQDSALMAVEEKFPGTGSRLQDALDALGSKEYNAIADKTDERIVALGRESIKRLIVTGGLWLSMGKDIYHYIQESLDDTQRDAPGKRQGNSPSENPEVPKTGDVILDKLKDLKKFFEALDKPGASNNPPVDEKEYPAMGVKFSSNLKGEAKIAKIVKDSPAEAAGIRVGDVIKGIDDQSVSSGQGAISAIRSKTIGDSVKILLLREDQSKSEVNLVLISNLNLKPD